MTQKALQDAGNPTAMDDATATRLGLKKYVHGTTYFNGIAPTITATASGLVVGVNSIIPYQMQDGSWRLKGNIATSYSSNTNGDIFIAGITTTADSQPIAVNTQLNTINNNYFGGSGNQIVIRFSTGKTISEFSFDVALASKPTFAY
jgi:hypothetical protein